MTKTVKYPRLLKTNPTGEDHFTGGAQGRVASAIAANIDDESFKLIGLDGPWGSGKSNVIQMLAEKLSDTHHFFIYDAWSHQEDLQRRTFLEELTEDLTNKNIVDRDYWRKQLKNLLAKEKTVVSKVVPRLSIAILITLFIATLIPISKAITDSMNDAQWAEKIWISLIPFGVAIIVYVAAGLMTGVWGIQELFAIYKESETEKTMSEVISESEPSAAKFRKWMKQLEGALESKKLVIVFDNMDRLPNEKVQSLWSNIHTFFSEDKKYTKISVIVPFDREHIGIAFGGTRKVEGQPYEPGNAPYFIKKTFPVVFTVPPAALTDWRGFFDIKYESAFGTKSDCDTVATIYEIYNRSMTPRDVISFINDIVGLKLIWQEEIEIKYLALFAATRLDHFPNPSYDILRGEFAVPANTIFRGDDNLTGIIAALYYNIDPQRAGEITLYRAIEEALHERKPDHLLEFSKLADFYLLLDHIVTRGNSNVEQVAYTLNEFERLLDDEAELQKLEKVWDHLIRKKMGLRIDAENDFTGTDEILLLHASKGTRLVKLAKCIADLLADPRSSTGKTYGTALKAFRSFVEHNKLEIDLSDLWKPKQLYGDQYLLFAEAVGDQFNDFKVVTQTEDLQSRIIEKLPNNLHEIFVGPYLQLFQLPLLRQRIEEVIATPAIGEKLELVYNLYKQIAAPPLKMPEDANVASWLNSSEMYSSHFYELAAMRLALGPKITSSGHCLIVLSSPEPDFVLEMGNRVLYYAGVDELLYLTFKMESANYPRIVKHIMANDFYKREEFDFVKVLPRLGRIAELLEISNGDLLDYLSKWADLISSQIEPNEFANHLPDLDFFETLMVHSSPMSDAVIQQSVYYVGLWTKDEWIELFQSPDSYNWRLLEILLKSGTIEKLSVDISRIFGDSLLLLAEPENSAYDVFDFPKTVELFFERSDWVSLIVPCILLRDKLIGLNAIDGKNFLLFEPMLRQNSQVFDKAGEVVNHVLSHCFDEVAFVDRLVEQREFYLQLVHKASADAINFINAFRRFIEAHENETRINDYESLLRDFSIALFADIKIVSGSYYSSVDTDIHVDVTDRLAELAKKGLLYHKKVDNSIVDEDPHLGIPKRLFLHFEYKNENEQKTINETGWISIPEN